MRLNLPPRAIKAENFIISDANQAAVDLLIAWHKGPHQHMALIGERGSGKTMLLSYWASEGVDITIRPSEQFKLEELLSKNHSAIIAIDDADKLPETTLWELYNLAEARERKILFTSHIKPASWATAPLDLVSRLASLPIIDIKTPNETQMAQILIKKAETRYIKLPENVAGFLAKRIERSYQRMEDALDALEYVMDKYNRPPTLDLARQIVEAELDISRLQSKT